MKHPLWILNSALLILVFSAIGFILTTGQKPSIRTEIEPSATIKPLKGEIAQINISKIYENDLFGTFKRELPQYMAGTVPSIPEPPSPRSSTVPTQPKPQFLDPLNVSLKGIIIMLNDDGGNRAIIMDNKTSKEATYQVGQMIEDAQIIQILSNKVILLRSNGQQEVLYLREKDAQDDPAYLSIDNWTDVVQKIADTEYSINMHEFVNRVKNLSQFIDMLDLITVYKHGKSVGCHVGNIGEKSLGQELGLQQGDVILSINEVPATDTGNRFKIYKAITNMQQNDVIIAKVKRRDDEIALHYVLKDRKPDTKSTDQEYKTMSSEDIRQEKVRILQQKHKFAPTLKQIRETERQNMMQRGKTPLPDTTQNITSDQAKAEKNNDK